MITIDDTGQVRCCPDETTILLCDPLQMWEQKAECGNCPIIAMCEKYETLKYGDCEH